MTNYEAEVKARWGETEAYRQYAKKTKTYTQAQIAGINDGLMAVFAEFAACKQSGAAADSANAQALVSKLQAYITEHYYTCTPQILHGLGEMYVADERFRKNIDKCGEGTAVFAAAAIAVFCEVK